MEDRRGRRTVRQPVRSSGSRTPGRSMNDRDQGCRNTPNGRKSERQSQMQKRRRNYKIVSWVLTGILVIVLYALICLIIGNRRLYDNTNINGIDVGKLTSEEAAKLVSAGYSGKYSSASVQVELNGDRYTLDISRALNTDAYKSVKSIQDSSHRFWRRGYGFLESKICGCEYVIYPTVADVNALENAVKSSGMMDVDLSRKDGYKIEGDKLLLTKGEGSYEVDMDKLTAAICRQANKGNYTAVIKCPERQVDVDMDALYKKIHCEPQDPTLDPDNGYTVVESKDGVDFDLEAAKRLLSQAKRGDEVVIPLTLTSADMTTDEYKKLLFRDQMSTYTTEVEGSDNRKTNVKMAAQYCDGTILMPGESFSYNLGVGELTEERGFLPGPSYANGESVLDMGGGICQVSSTLYMACLYANLQIDERHCHPYPASYVPAGLDATVAWGGCDFVFTNDTGYPIKINTTYDGYSTSCTIWGTITKQFSVELYTETIETEPYETKYELDKTLAKDEQVLDTTGIDGLTIQSYRRVYDGDGNVISDDPEAISVYSVRDEVYKVGKLPSKNKNDKKSEDKTTEDPGDKTERDSEDDTNDDSANQTEE